MIKRDEGEKKTSTTPFPFKNYTVIEWTQLHTKKHTFSANQYKKRQWHLFLYEIDATSPKKQKQKKSSKYSCLNYLQVVTQGIVCEWNIRDKNDKMPRVQRHGRAGVCFGSSSDSCSKACELRSCSASISPSSLAIYSKKKMHPIIKNINKWCHAIWAEWNELMTGTEPQRF